jgi:hypothetical protein
VLQHPPEPVRPSSRARLVREAGLLNGIDNILPRPDMDPRAFLGVTITQATQQVA